MCEEKTKKCSKCERFLPVTEEYFYKNNNGKDGFVSECKDCRKEYYKQWAGKNKEHLQDYQKKYCEEHKESKSEYDKQRYPQYYEENRDKILRYHSEHYQLEEVKNRHRKWLKKWRKDNPDKTQVYKLKRRTLEKELPSTLTPEDWARCKEYFNNRCAYCGKEAELTLDHFIPVSKMGELSINNSIPACLSCNSSKGAQLFDIWYPKQEFYDKKREKTLLEFLGYKGRMQQLALM